MSPAVLVCINNGITKEINMKFRSFSIQVLLTVILMLFLLSSASAQFRGGTRPGGGPRPGGGIGNAPFGAGSVVHRNFTPPAGMSRPNINPMPTHSRPNTLSDLRSTSRPTTRPKPDLPVIPNRPGSHDPLLPDRPTVHGGDHPRPDKLPHAGPDWKNWQKIDPGKIHDTVVNKIDVNDRTVVNIRNHFKTNYENKKFWTPDWFERHPGCWHPHGPPPPPTFWWHRPDWGKTWAWFAAGFFAGAVVDAVIEPVPYNYGNNIVYEGETVYINGVSYVDADEYYQQAQDLAETGAESIRQEPIQAGDEESQGEWLPMGTFAIAADNRQTDSKRIIQIATNKQGQIRGNIVDVETDKATELYGSVDAKTQRVAFKIEGHEETVAECGLWNLTQETVPLLIHVDKNKTEERTLIRLHEGEKADTETPVAP